jgi:hypothetical protein
MSVLADAVRDPSVEFHDDQRLRLAACGPLGGCNPDEIVQRPFSHGPAQVLGNKKIFYLDRNGLFSLIFCCGAGLPGQHQDHALLALQFFEGYVFKIAGVGRHDLCRLCRDGVGRCGLRGACASDPYKETDYDQCIHQRPVCLHGFTSSCRSFMTCLRDSIFPSSDATISWTITLSLLIAVTRPLFTPIWAPGTSE